MAKWILAGLGALVLAAALYVAGAWLHLYGDLWHAGEPTPVRVPAEVVAARVHEQQQAAASQGADSARQILFGDLHVHTTFSTDAFLWSLPMVRGEGAHPVADACDFARFCSALDFWSINDHAEATSPRKWRETRESIRQCNALAGDPANPDVAVFLGWEWSQVGQTPDEHYGHKNVMFLGESDDEVPPRAIGAAGLATDGLRGSIGRTSPAMAFADFANRQPYYDFLAFMDEVAAVPACPEDVPTTELPADCYESARTPAQLFEKLDAWGFDSLVIPHGNTWGFYSPPGISWDKQLVGAQHDPDRQRLVEVMSGHGNSEEYRDWRAVAEGPAGEPVCPEPTDDYLPTCWRAGELVEARCLDAGGGADACAARAADARQRTLRMGAAGALMVPDAEASEWLDAGQCRDCFLPAFNYRPGGSSQYALAVSNFDEGEPRRFHFGFIASSDNHRARPGTGYKEFGRHINTEAAGPRDEAWRQRILGRKAGFDPWIDDEEELREQILAMGFVGLESERQTSFFTTGGLVAVHADGRSRQDVWDALQRREVYGTSGDRILLWFDLLPGAQSVEGAAAGRQGAEGAAARVPMGSEVTRSDTPRFRVRAVGAFRQEPGCPEHAVGALGAERLQHLCRGQCYNPSSERKPITRIEVVRIRPQARPGEPVGPLIEDPWRVLPCPGDAGGCEVEFEDPDFAADGRDSVYYVRAIEPPTPVVNADPLRCERDAEGRCTEVHLCYGDYRTNWDDDCLAPAEERAWSSPIFVDHGGA